MGRVDQQNVDTLIQKVKQFINNGETTINVNFDSVGGQIEHGITGYEQLSVYRDNLKMNNLRFTDSSAVLLFCAGNVRVCNSGASFLIHSTALKSFNPQTANPKHIQANKQNVAVLNNVQVDIIFRTTGIAPAQILSWVSVLPNGTRLTDTQALQHGLVQTINPTPIVPSANGITIP